MNVTKIILDGQVADIPSGGGSGGDSIPSGLICMWSGSTPPDGWALCDGENGTPDLRGRFVLGESTSHALGSKGGSETVSLNNNNLPPHDHVENLLDTSKNVFATRVYGSNKSGGPGGYATAGGIENSALNVSYNSSTNLLSVIKTLPNSTTNTPHNNMPPYYTLAYIMKL